MSIQAMKQALEALESPTEAGIDKQVIDDLRAAIEAAEKVEPVAITCNAVTNTGYVYIKALDRTIPHGTKLYATPQPAITADGDL